MTKSFDKYFDEKMKDPKFKKEYDALDPEFEIIEAMIEARKASGLTQKQLSEKTGINQADISRMEHGNGKKQNHLLYQIWIQ